MKKIFLILSLVTSLSLFANEVEIKTINQTRKEIKADTAKIDLVIKTRESDRNLSQKKNSENLDKFIKELSNKGIKIDSLVTENYRYYKSEELVDSKGEKIYKNSISFSIVSNYNENSKIIEALENVGINSYRVENNEFIFEIVSENSNKNKSLEEIYSKVDSLKKMLGKDFKLVFFENYSDNKEVREVKYEVQTLFSLKLRDLSKLTELLNIAEKYDVYMEGNIDYSVSNIKDIYMQMYKENFEKANKKVKVLSNGSSIKEVKSIEENRYVVDALEKKVDINNENEYRVATYTAQEFSTKMLGASPRALEATIEKPKTNIFIPSINLENKLEIVFVTEDGKENNRSKDKKIKLYGVSTKDIRPDYAIIDIKINTESKKSLEQASTDNSKALEKLKDILKLANLSYEKIETLNYLTDKEEYDRYVLRDDNKKEEKNEATLLIGFNDVYTVNYRKFLDVIINNNVNLIKEGNNTYLEIKKQDTSAKKAYDSAVDTFNKINKELIKINIATNIVSYKNEKVDSKKEVLEKEVNYITDHSISLKIRDLKNISLIVSIIRELGLGVEDITYFLDDISKYENVMYKEALNDVESKKNNFNNIDNLKIGNITKIIEEDKEITNKLYTDKVYINVYGNTEIDLKSSNKEILDRAYDNLQNIFIKSKNLKIKLDVDMGMK